MTAADTGVWHLVRVHTAAGPASDESVRGHTRDEAIANAEQQWPAGRVEYLAAENPFVDDLADNSDGDEDVADEDEPRDWWGDDFPDDDAADADAA